MERQSPLKDPRDLSQIPGEFFQSERYLSTPAFKDSEELKHYRSVVAAFLNYQYDSILEFNKAIGDYSKLTPSQLKLLKYPPFYRMQQFHKAMSGNFSLLKKVVADDMHLFAFKDPRIFDAFQITAFNKRQVRYVLKQLRREWSAEGKEERDQAFRPILGTITKLYESPQGKKVLVPGCGLGRLPYELAKLGFDAQGNEFSYFMLLASDFVLNKRTENEQYAIFPYFTNLNNLFKLDSAFAHVIVPDEPVLSVPAGVEFSMVAGEFVEVYKDQKSSWDVIVTCFFIDTAKNILEYIEVIYGALRKGGYWINLGPLMYHYSDMPDEMSIELSMEEVLFAVRALGFEMIKEEALSATYCGERDRMVDYTYNCSFFLAKK